MGGRGREKERERERERKYKGQTSFVLIKESLGLFPLNKISSY